MLNPPRTPSEIFSDFNSDYYSTNIRVELTKIAGMKALKPSRMLMDPSNGFMNQPLAVEFVVE